MLLSVPALGAADEAVLALIAEQHRRLVSLLADPRRWSSLLRRTALARAVRASTAIEGLSVTADDAFAVLDDQEPLEATELVWPAVRGYRDAVTYALQLAIEQRLDISAHTLRALHFMLQQHDLDKWPGRWRPDGAYVYDEENRFTVYVGPAASEVPGLVAEFVDGVTTADSTPVIIKAALAHLNLVLIHPFKEGNGRLARCVQTLILACEPISLAPEFRSIEEYLGRNQQAYRQVLAQVGDGSWSPDRDATPWIRFCLTAHYRQAVRLERRSELTRWLWLLAAEEVKGAGLPERCTRPLTYCMTSGLLRNSTYRQLTEGLSQNVAGRDLTELARADLLAPRGEKRGRHYVPSARMRAAADEAGAGLPLSAEHDPYEMARL